MVVRLDRYDSDFEKEYWNCVNCHVSQIDQKDIVASCKKFMPSDFFSRKPCFEELVLAPYEKIKNAVCFIKQNEMKMKKECFYINDTGKTDMSRPFKNLYHAYEGISQCIRNEVRMNVMLVRQLGLSVCPYCNRDYINSRADRFLGAQLDHFYPRSLYPVFSACLYNLVPSCGTCNRLKSDNRLEFASPFDEEINWEESVKFSYEPTALNGKKIIIKAQGSVKHNIEEMHIEEAYQIHDLEVNELLDKVAMYTRTQFEEFRCVFGKAGMTELEMKQMVFGYKITEGDMKRKPLARMMRDLERELDIYE